MKEVFEFLQIYWKELFYGFCALLSLVCVICRKSKVKVVDSVFEQAIQKLPRWILIAESVFSSGISKKDYVISEALRFISELSHEDYEVVSKEYEARLSTALENILSTPTKKGVKYETKNEKEC